MCCCNCHCEAIAAVAKERDELKRTLTQRDLELKGANAACGELMAKVEELQARVKVREAAPDKPGNKIAYPERTKVYNDALKHFGPECQYMKAIEEMSELTKELSKGWFGPVNSDGIIEEIADVTIMLEQLRLIFGINDAVCARMDEKVERLAKRIASEK